MKKLTELVLNKDAAGFKDAFEQLVATKVFDALESQKIEVAQNFFGELEEGSPEFNARALRHGKADAAEKNKEGKYSKKYPGGKKQHDKDTAAFMKRFPAPKNEEAEQVYEASDAYGDKDATHMAHFKHKKMNQIIAIPVRGTDRDNAEHHFKKRFGKTDAAEHSLLKFQPIKEEAYLGQHGERVPPHQAAVFDTHSDALAHAREHGHPKAKIEKDRMSARGHVVKVSEETMQRPASTAKDGVTRLGFRSATKDIVAANNRKIEAKKRKKVKEEKEHGNEGFGAEPTHGNITKGWPMPKHGNQGYPKTKDETCSECGMKTCDCSMEEGYVNELNKSTLASYIGKAATSIHNRAWRGGEHQGRTGKIDKHNLVGSVKRQMSIGLAAKKLAKEETE